MYSSLRTKAYQTTVSIISDYPQRGERKSDLFKSDLLSDVESSRKAQALMGSTLIKWILKQWVSI